MIQSTVIVVSLSLYVCVFVSRGAVRPGGLPDQLTALALDTVAAAVELPAMRLSVLQRATAAARAVIFPRLTLNARDKELWAEDSDECASFFSR